MKKLACLALLVLGLMTADASAFRTRTVTVAHFHAAPVARFNTFGAYHTAGFGGCGAMFVTPAPARVFATPFVESPPVVIEQRFGLFGGFRSSTVIFGR